MLRDKYKPAQWSDFVGNTAAVKQIRDLLTSKRFNGGAFWITGPSGTGKTTIANLIASTVGACDLAVTDLDGDKCDLASVRELKETLPLCPFVGEWKVVVVNEAHAMTAKAVQAWLTLLDNLPGKRIVVFTTTESAEIDLFGQFTGPLLGRCYPVELAAPTEQEIAFRLLAIASAENIELDGAAALRVAKVSSGSIRAAIQRLDIGSIPPPAPVEAEKPKSRFDSMKFAA